MKLPIAITLDRDRIARFCQALYIRTLALFGSVTRSDFHGGSDVDVLVEFESSHVPGLAFFAMEDERGQIVGRKVDLNTANFLSPDFRDQVIAEGEALYDHE
jgi:predicted nucleotidyltransferase